MASSVTVETQAAADVTAPGGAAPEPTPEDPNKWHWGTGEAQRSREERPKKNAGKGKELLLSPQEKRQLRKLEIKEKRAARAQGRASEFDVGQIHKQLIEAADDDSDNDSSGRFDYIVTPVALPKELRKLVWRLAALFYYEAKDQGGGQKRVMVLSALYSSSGKRKRPDKNQRAAAEVLLEDWRKASAGEKSKELLEGAGKRFAERKNRGGGRGPRPSSRSPDRLRDDHDEAAEHGKTTDYLLYTESGITAAAGAGGRQRKVDRKKEKAMKGGGRHNKKGHSHGDDARSSANALRSFTAFLPSSDGGLKPYKVDVDGNLVPQPPPPPPSSSEGEGAAKAAGGSSGADESGHSGDDDDDDADDDEDNSEQDSDDSSDYDDSEEDDDDSDEDEDSEDEDDESEQQQSEEEEEGSSATPKKEGAVAATPPEAFFLQRGVIGSEEIEAPVVASPPVEASAVVVPTAADAAAAAPPTPKEEEQERQGGAHVGIGFASPPQSAESAFPSLPSLKAEAPAEAGTPATPATAAAAAAGAGGAGSAPPPSSSGQKKLWGSGSRPQQHAPLPSSTISSSPYAEFETRRLFVDSSLRGEWERHTTGIGSKLMAKMGYTGGHLGRGGAGESMLQSPPSLAASSSSSSSSAASPAGAASAANATASPLLGASSPAPVLKDGRVVVVAESPMPEPISAEKRLGRAGIGAYDGLAGVAAARDEKAERGGGGGSGRGHKKR